MAQGGPVGQGSGGRPYSSADRAAKTQKAWSSFALLRVFCQCGSGRSGGRESVEDWADVLVVVLLWHDKVIVRASLGVERVERVLQIGGVAGVGPIVDRGAPDGAALPPIVGLREGADLPVEGGVCNDGVIVVGEDGFCEQGRRVQDARCATTNCQS